MATVRELEQQIRQLRSRMEAHGLFMEDLETMKLPERSDHIPFGSSGHMAFLGLSRVEDPEEVQEDGNEVYKSPKTGRHYTLVDEMSAVQMMRPMDPDKGIKLVLRQKVNAFESGPPPVPDDAPAMFIPPGMERIR